MTLNAVVESPVTPFQRTARTVAVWCVAAWIAALVLMWLTTANPLVISRAQLRRSDLVVTARIVDRERDRIEVERVFTGNVRQHDRLTVLNLVDAQLPAAEEEWIMPLESFRGDYRIATVDDQQVRPLVYRAAPDAVEQTKLLLQGMGR
jgi:hypothetical protein